MVRFYIPDLLWAFSFAISLNLFSNKKKSNIANLFIVFITGLLYELSQKYNLLPGTFDVLDILIYLIGLLISHIVINILENRLS